MNARSDVSSARWPLLRLPTICLPLLLVGCSEGKEFSPQVESAGQQTRSTDGETDSVRPPAVQPADLGHAEPAHVVGNLYLAGLPEPEDFSAWKRMGVQTVVSILGKGEIEWDEQSAVEKAGMKFVHIPFEGDDQVFDRTRELLAKNGDQPLVLHCQSSGRVGAVWLARRVLDEGIPLETALDEAERVGLRSSRLERRAVDYIERKLDQAQTASGSESNRDAGTKGVTSPN